MDFFNNIYTYNAKLNLAIEEVLFNIHESEDIFLLWQNLNSVIIGKNQITQNEINKSFLDMNNIELVRRKSGGGAVYHDLGNLNFTLISKSDPDIFLNTILSALKHLDNRIDRSGRNDLVLDGYKISGISLRSVPEKNLLHGTLLINENLDVLGNVLNPDDLKLKTRGIASVKKRVENLTTLTGRKLSVEMVKNLLIREFDRQFGLIERPLTHEIIEKALHLKEEYYSKDSWNYNEITRHSFTQTKKFPAGLVTVSFTLKDNRIINPILSGDFFSKKDITILQSLIDGIEFNFLEDKLKTINLNDYITGISKEEFLQLFEVISEFKRNQIKSG